jgi:hypothetical protein
MRRAALGAGLVALWALGGCGGGASGTVGRACLAGGRDAASARLCSCVQGVADQTLSRADQGRAAGFFASPEAAEGARRSDSAGDDAFWDRYRAFADRAEATCG